MIVRDSVRPLHQQLAFAVAKAAAVTLAFLAGHVTLAVATDLGRAAPDRAPAPTQVVDGQQTAVSTP